MVKDELGRWSFRQKALTNRSWWPCSFIMH